MATMRRLGFAAALAATGASADMSPFEKMANTSNYACNHYHSRSKCTDDQFAGVIMFFHGFSACSSQIHELAPVLNQRCFDVVSPTSPGHTALPVGDCGAPGAVCTVKWGANQGFDLHELPARRTPYMHFAKSMGKLASDELEFRAKETGKDPKSLVLGALGLSFGGPLATYAITSNPGTFTRQLLLNPAFGTGLEDIDEKLYECMSQPEEESHEKKLKICADRMEKDWANQIGGEVGDQMVKYLIGLQDTPAAFERALNANNVRLIEDLRGNENSKCVQASLDTIFNTEVLWGDNCPKIFSANPPRNGFCKFQQQHILATNSFSLYGLIEATSKPNLFAPYPNIPVTQLILTERDGMTRNGFSYGMAQRWHANKQAPSVASCIYRFKNGTNRWDTAAYWSNDNVVPHANIDPTDNPGQDLWWQANLFNQIASFFSGEATVSGSKDWDGSREQCVDMDMSADALEKSPWLSEVVLPDVAPSSMYELKPDLFWLGTVMNLDFWASTVGCKVQAVRATIDGFIDCSMFDKPAETLPVLV